METRGLDTHGDGGFATGEARLYASGSAREMAMVGSVAPSFSEYLGGDFGDLAGGAPVSRTGARECGGRGRHGRHRQPGECVGARVLGLGLRRYHPESDFLRDVSASGCALLVPA